MLVFWRALLLVFVAGAVASAQTSNRNFDEFGDINCEDEMARLDNLGVTLQNSPNDIAAIIFYGGQRFRGRLPKRGEAARSRSSKSSFAKAKRAPAIFAVKFRK